MKIFEVKQISVLSQMEETMNFGDNVFLRRNAIANNPYREDLDADIYSKYLDVYAKVATFYINFFVCYWYKDYVEKTNEKMIAEMEKVALSNWSGLSETENNPLGEYVLSLNYPAKISDIKDFFRRVMMGDLKFLCCYPIDDTNAFELIKKTNIEF